MSYNNLPYEVLLKIFEDVRGSDLINIRLVCRNWAQVVSDSLVFRRKYTLVVKEAILDDNHPFIQTFLRSPHTSYPNIRFRDVVVQPTKKVEELWKKIGANIECLRFELSPPSQKSDIITESYEHNWVILLKYTPNLIELEIYSLMKTSPFNKYSNFEESFNLKKLKKVILCCRNNFMNVYLMQILIKSANKLAALHVEERNPKEVETLHSLIESQRHSLKELTLGSRIEKEYLQNYLSIENLSLEVLRMNFKFVLDSDLLELLGMQRNVHEVKSYVDSSENLQLLCIFLYRLEKLDVNIKFNSNYTTHPFPKNLHNLKSLKVGTNTTHDEYDEVSTVAFETPTNCPTLEILEIVSPNLAKISSTSLLSFIDSYPYLRVLKLMDYSCDSRLVAVIADKLLLLEHLELRLRVTDSHFERNAFSNISKLSKLKHLSVFDYIYICDDRFFTEHLRLPALISLKLEVHKDLPRVEGVTDQGISGLIDNCPLLEDLHLSCLDGITEASLDKIDERLVHLQKLFISGNSITDGKLEEIRKILQNRLQCLDNFEIPTVTTSNIHDLGPLKQTQTVVRYICEGVIKLLFHFFGR